MEEYRERYQDPLAAVEYHANIQPPSKVRTFLDLRRLFAWLVSVAERKSISVLVRRLKLSGFIIDVPCGSGKLLSAWFEDLWAIGVDSSRPMLALFRGNGGRETLQADVSHLPFKSNSIQLVVCNRFLHRVPAQQRVEVLKEIRRISSAWAVLYYAVFHRGRTWIVQLNRRVGLADSNRIFLCSVNLARDELRSAGWRISAESAILGGVSAGHVFLVERA